MENNSPATQPNYPLENQTVFAALRDALAALYTEAQDARLIVDDAGLDAIAIAFSPRARTNWHHILTKALRQNRLDALLDLACNEYFDNQALSIAYIAYRRWLKQGGQLTAPPQPLVQDESAPSITTGGLYVAGSVTTSGAVIGRDQHIHGDLVQGDKVMGNQIIYPSLPPPALDAATVAAAKARLAQLPVDSIPAIATLPPGSRMPLSMNPLFVGRETDLKTLAATLKGGTTVAVNQIAAATGLGGIGKTQLAVAFVHHYGQFFAGGVQWLSFADPGAVPAEIVACGGMMPDLRADFATLDLETQARLVLAAWQSPLPRLLVFDNCEEPALLAQWRPPTGGSRVLVTSRRRTWDAGLGVQLLSLDTLSRVQSVELLRKFRPDLVATDPVLDQIAAELGDLPLALHLAGSYLARYRQVVTPASYLAKLQQPDLLAHRSLQAGDLSPTGHVQHVERTFALSYERLHPTDSVDALALALLAQAAWFAPGQLIPRPLLLASMEQDEKQAHIASSLHKFVLDLWRSIRLRKTRTSSQIINVQAIEDALQRLANLGLVEIEAEGNLRMHRLVMGFARSADKETSQAAQSAVAATLLAEASRLNHTGIPGPLLLWQSHLRHITEAVKDRADVQAAGLCNTFGYHLYMIGNYAAARPYYERALAIRQKVLGDNHLATATSLDHLGLLLQAQGDYAAARPYYERALAIRQKVLGDNHLATATSLDHLGLLLQAQGDYAAARPYYERALAIRQKVLGDNHLVITASLDHLVLLQARRSYIIAYSYDERAVAIRQKVLGDNHLATAASLDYLRTLQARRSYITSHSYIALSYDERAAIEQKVLGDSYLATAASLNYLRTLLEWKDDGDYIIAYSYDERAVAIKQKVLGDNHLEIAHSLNNLGYLLQAQGDYAAAQPYYECALAIYETVLGPKHPGTARSLNNLGYLLQAQGDYAAAQPYYECALAIYETVLGPKHPDTACILNNLGYLLQAQGDYAAAQPYYEFALAICEEVLGRKHPDTARSLNNLGALLQAQGDYAAAQLYYERALAIYEAALGPKHPDTARSLNNLGALLASMNDYAAAQPYYERALAICEEVLGRKHPDTARILNNLGYHLYMIGNYAAAQPYYERALAIYEAALGPKHPDTAASLHNLGALLQTQGDYTAARPYYERALAILEEQLGASHPDTERVRSNLNELEG